jgi:transcriptional regulator with XRE-family HTH domain
MPIKTPPAPLDTKNRTRVGEIISAKMEEKGLSIRDLAVSLDTAYEHMRRIVKGEGVPSKFLLKSICQELGINYKEAERLVTSDQIEKKYGKIPMEISGKNPEIEPIERVWTHLTNDQKNDIITMVQGWARRNKALKVTTN